MCFFWFDYILFVNLYYLCVCFPHSALETINPIISCPPDVMRYISSSTEEVSVTWPLPTASDSSGITSIISNPVYSSGSGMFGSGTHYISYTATDGAGNQASCYFTITVTCKHPHYTHLKQTEYKYFHGKCATSVPDLVPPIRMFEREYRLSASPDPYTLHLFGTPCLLHVSLHPKI